MDIQHHSCRKRSVNHGLYQTMSAYRGRSVDLAPRLGCNWEVHNGRNQRQAVTEQEIFPFQRSQLIRVEFVKEGEVYIARHSQGPECICGHKSKHPSVWQGRPRPVRAQAYTWIKKPWSWHNAEPSPACMPDLDMRVATLQIIFPQAA